MSRQVSVCRHQSLSSVAAMQRMYNPHDPITNQSSTQAHVFFCSGSGKSTLLDILAQRKTVGKVTGEVLIAGQKPTQTFLRRYSGYVEQFDTLLPVLTVYEMLLYTAELKQPRSVPLQARFDAMFMHVHNVYDAICMCFDAIIMLCSCLTFAAPLAASHMCYIR